MNLLVSSNVLLWMAVLVLALIVLVLARQIGILHERLPAAGALSMNRRLRPGDAAPVLQVNDLNGRELRVGGARADGRATLLAFIAPGCPVCSTVLPALRAVATSERTGLDLILSSDGDPHEHRDYVNRQRLGELSYVLSAEMGLRYGVAQLPFACLIDSDGRIAALGLVNSREHLDSLIEAGERRTPTIQQYLARERAADGASA